VVIGLSRWSRSCLCEVLFVGVFLVAVFARFSVN
jgi:hypothetical protein